MPRETTETARQYLNDLEELRRRTSDQIAKGLANRNLTEDEASRLARDLGLPMPRVRRDHTVYFDVLRTYAVTVSAHDPDEAVAAAERFRDNMNRRIDQGYDSVGNGALVVNNTNPDRRLSYVRDFRSTRERVSTMDTQPPARRPLPDHLTAQGARLRETAAQYVREAQAERDIIF